ncbi:MAG: cytochrome P450 [Bdellovibrionales bacterium]|nr:cytochrome P450 [Bdellovibrionales bacterium]
MPFSAAASYALLRAKPEQDIWVSLLKQHGDIVYLPWLNVYFVDRPSVVHEILKKRHDVFVRGPAFRASFGRAIGRGLITNEGTEWHFTRRLVHAEFKPKSIADSSLSTFRFVQNRIASWEDSAKSGVPLDVSASLYHIHLSLIGKFLFNNALDGLLDVIHGHVTRVSAETYRRSMPPGLFLPWWFPLPGSKRAHESREQLRVLLRQLISTDCGPTIKHLQNAVAKDGKSEQWLEGELMTLLWTGHETSSQASAWMCFHVAQQQEVQERLYEEIRSMEDAIADGSALDEKLPYHKQVVDEALRLSPAVPRVGRTLIEDCEVDGVLFRKNAHIAISPYVVHRHPEYWEEPEVFDPERFSASNKDSITPGSYIPFAVGPHRCIGQHLAVSQMITVLANTVRKYRFTLANTNPVKALDHATLVPSEHIYLRLEVRK